MRGDIGEQEAILKLKAACQAILIGFRDVGLVEKAEKLSDLLESGDSRCWIFVA